MKRFTTYLPEILIGFTLVGVGITLFMSVETSFKQRDAEMLSILNTTKETYIGRSIKDVARDHGQPFKVSEVEGIKFYTFNVSHVLINFTVEDSIITKVVKQ